MCRSNKKTILQHTITALAKALIPIFPNQSCHLAIAKNDTIAKHLIYDMPIHWVIGGTERIHSVFAGVSAVWQQVQQQPQEHWVLIHDAVRPLVHQADICQLLQQATHHPSGGILATPIKDTIKQAHPSTPPSIQKTLDRNQLWSAQTPQLFPLAKLYPYLQQAIAQNIMFTDEASVFEHFGESPLLIASQHPNIKLTYPEDLQLIQALLTI